MEPSALDGDKGTALIPDPGRSSELRALGGLRTLGGLRRPIQQPSLSSPR